MLLYVIYDVLTLSYPSICPLYAYGTKVKPVPPPTLPPPPKDCLIDIAVGIDIAGESGDLLLFYHNQLRLNLMPTLMALNNLLPSTCTRPLSVRFGFHVPNTDPPFVTTFQPLTDDVVKQLEMRVIRETSRLDARYLLSFGEKFRRESDRNTYIQVHVEHYSYLAYFYIKHRLRKSYSMKCNHSIIQLLKMKLVTRWHNRTDSLTYDSTILWYSVELTVS